MHMTTAVAAASLLWLGLSSPGLAAEPEQRLSVVSRSPGLSVEARSVSLPQVLSEIGKKVGFGVVDLGASGTVRDVSTEGATLEEVLRQLLSGENYVIVYREEREGMQRRRVIDKIVLLSPTSYAQPVRVPEDQRQVEKRQEGIIPGQVEVSPSLDSSPPHEATLASSEEQVRMRDGITNHEGAGVKVEEILRVHALSGLGGATGTLLSKGSTAEVNQPLQGTDRAAGQGSTRRMSTPSIPWDAGETLAITTRLAQQNLKALIEGLTTATNSFLRSSPDKGE